jgi:hypothetical protein
MFDDLQPAVRLGAGNKEGCMQAIRRKQMETALNELLMRHGDNR